MLIASIILYLSTAVWLIPPFRQNKGNFFYFFLIMALADPISLFLARLHISNPESLYIVTAGACLVSIIGLNKKLSWVLAFPFMLLTLFVGFTMTKINVELMAAAILIVLFFFVVRYIIIFAGMHRYIGVFHILFLIYDASLIFKLINYALNFQKGWIFFYFTSAFEIIIGVLFCFFREETERFAIRF